MNRPVRESVGQREISVSMKRSRKACLFLSSLSLLFLMSGCCPDTINAIHHSSFDDDGHLTDTLSQQHFVAELPVKIKFYVEASGSMNGFFRSNKATQFKHDVWSIFSDFEALSDKVYVFEQQKVQPKEMGLQEFRQGMNGGTFLSSASTEVPEMFETVINSLNSEAGEAAILVSDMKYSPVGSRAMDVKLSQYASDIRNIVMKNPHISLSLVAATSDFLDKRGDVACPESPYYYLIIGKSENVVWLKNCIATILQDYGRYVDAIDCGIDFKSPSFNLRGIDNGFQLDGEPTITDIDEDYSDTCSFEIVVDLKDYPWKLVDDNLLKDSLRVKSVNGSNIKVDTIIYNINNHAGKQLKREAKAVVKLKVFDMFSDADVIEWSLGIPEMEICDKFASFLGAASESDLSKSFSIENFIQGCFRGKSNEWCGEPNRILLSKTKQ